MPTELKPNLRRCPNCDSRSVRRETKLVVIAATNGSPKNGGSHYHAHYEYRCLADECGYRYTTPPVYYLSIHT